MLKVVARLTRETWYFWVFFLLFGFVSGLETETSRIPARLDLVMAFGLPLLIGLWVTLDARRRERPLGYSFPALVIFLWPVFAPIYLFQTRGARAIFSMTGFAALFCAAAGVGGLIAAYFDTSP